MLEETQQPIRRFLHLTDAPAEICQCLYCGYLLKDTNAERCSECGKAILPQLRGVPPSALIEWELRLSATLAMRLLCTLFAACWNYRRFLRKLGWRECKSIYQGNTLVVGILLSIGLVPLLARLIAAFTLPVLKYGALGTSSWSALWRAGLIGIAHDVIVLLASGLSNVVILVALALSSIGVSRIFAMRLSAVIAITAIGPVFSAFLFFESLATNFLGILMSAFNWEPSEWVYFGIPWCVVVGLTATTWLASILGFRLKPYQGLINALVAAFLFWYGSGALNSIIVNWAS